MEMRDKFTEVREMDLQVASKSCLVENIVHYWKWLALIIDCTEGWSCWTLERCFTWPVSTVQPLFQWSSLIIVDIVRLLSVHFTYVTFSSCGVFHFSKLMQAFWYNEHTCICDYVLSVTKEFAWIQILHLHIYLFKLWSFADWLSKAKLYLIC